MDRFEQAQRALAAAFTGPSAAERIREAVNSVNSVDAELFNNIAAASAMAGDQINDARRNIIDFPSQLNPTDYLVESAQEATREARRETQAAKQEVAKLKRAGERKNKTIARQRAENRDLESENMHLKRSLERALAESAGLKRALASRPAFSLGDAWGPRR